MDLVRTACEDFEFPCTEAQNTKLLRIDRLDIAQDVCGRESAGLSIRREGCGYKEFSAVDLLRNLAIGLQECSEYS